MGLATCKAGEPPLPLASGAWIKAPVGASIQVCSEPPSGNELWLAIDRFHALAMECILRRLEIARRDGIGAAHRAHQACRSKGARAFQRSCDCDRPAIASRALR